MIDGVILIAIMIPVFIAICQMIITVANGTGGTKGITQPYVTKSGQLHTAKKERSNYIV
tara:strand:+ start:547 stop:723 length:177 start_codon:yes stop_codon:yes gene_type:complete